MRRSTLVSLLVVGGVMGCADAPTTVTRSFGPSLAFVATEILDGGGFEGAGNQNIAIDAHWAPRAWFQDPSVLELNEESVCVIEGQCPIGTMTDFFAGLELPVAPPAGSECRPQNATDQTGSQCFAVITNANFRPNPDIVSGDVPEVVTALRSAIRGTSPFNFDDPPTVLTAGLEWRLVLDYAFLTSQAASADENDDFAQIDLSAPGVPTTAVWSTSRNHLLPGGRLETQVTPGGCGSETFGGVTHTLSLCTGWIRDTIVVPAAFIGSVITVTISIHQRNGQVIDEEIEDPSTGETVTRRVAVDNGRASFLAFDNLRFIGGIDEPDVPSPTAPVITMFPATGNEGAPISLRSTITDPNGTIASFSWVAPTGCTITLPTRTSSRLTCPDDGVVNVLLTATDNSGETSVKTVGVTVRNVAPHFETGFLEIPAAVRALSPFRAALEFSDQGTSDTHTATWTFNAGVPIDGTVIPASPGAHARVDDFLIAPAAGFWNLRLVVLDDDAGQRGLTQKLPVFDPFAGSVGGSGAGFLYGTPVSVAASARYADGSATVPTGAVTIIAPAKGISRFDASSITYLVISGSRATIEGFGTRNGLPGYAFTLEIIDPPGTTKPTQARFHVRQLGVVKGFDYQSDYFPFETGDIGIRHP